ncbi:hypothetical protein HN385_07980 [archaeon]|jgi:hypothetical protein|nr:hypothetical protein [archaeon]
MSGSINKILNDALDQTILNETVEETKVVTPTPTPVTDEKENLEEGRWSDMVKSMGKKGYEGGIPHSQREKDALAAQKLATMSKWGGAGIAGLGAGVGAVMLARKLRAKKKKAAAKKAKA